LKREELRTLESFLKSKEIIFRLRAVCGKHCLAKLDTICAHLDRIQVWSSAVLEALCRGDGMSNPGLLPATGDFVAYTLENDRYIIGAKRPWWVQRLYLTGGIIIG
jgi:hypothetical protein